MNAISLKGHEGISSSSAPVCSRISWWRRHRAVTPALLGVLKRDAKLRPKFVLWNVSCHHLRTHTAHIHYKKKCLDDLSFVIHPCLPTPVVPQAFILHRACCMWSSTWTLTAVNNWLGILWSKDKGGMWGKINDWFWPSFRNNWVLCAWWRRCLCFLSVKGYFHSGCYSEVSQVLSVWDWWAGLWTNSIYRSMWERQLFSLQSSQSSADFANVPSFLTILRVHRLSSPVPQLCFCFVLYFATSAPSLVPLIPLFHTCRFASTSPFLDSFGSSPQACLFSWDDAADFVPRGTVRPVSQDSRRAHKRTLAHILPVSRFLSLFLAVSPLAPRRNSRGNWSSVLSGRKSATKFLSTLISANLWSYMKSPPPEGLVNVLIIYCLWFVSF